MKVLRVRVEGLPLYKAPFDVSFYAVQRVEHNHLDAVSNLFGNIYINNVEAFIGINASGKTTGLKVLSFASLLLSAAPLNAKYVPEILGDNIKTVFDIDFYVDGIVYHLNSEIIKNRQADGTYIISIISEKLWAKTITSKVNKSHLLDFELLNPIRIRDNSDDYLPMDVSIMIAINKQIQNKSIFVDLTSFTDFNLFFSDGENVPTEIISLLDPSIEYISINSFNDEKGITKLKFYGKDELVLLNPAELNIYLSSGTIKGVRVFTDAIKVLKNGGYLMIDEIENHFNRELVASVLRLFMNKKTNPKGAVIIFSTHYPELLDELERNDSVFITRNNQGLTVDNLNTLLKRNDIKKSEIYQSNFLGGTAPQYKSLMALQKEIIRSMGE